MYDTAVADLEETVEGDTIDDDDSDVSLHSSGDEESLLKDNRWFSGRISSGLTKRLKRSFFSRPLGS